MSEEEIIEKIKGYIELLMCDERVLELPTIFQKEWADNLQALLDLYNILKEKYNFTIKNNLDDKYEEVLEKTFKKYIDKDFISKDKIRKYIKENKRIYEMKTPNRNRIIYKDCVLLTKEVKELLEGNE